MSTTIYIPTRRSAGVRYPPKVRKKAIRLRKKGRRVTDIVEALQPDAPSERTLRKWFRDEGLQVTRRGFDYAAALQDLQTMTVAAVALKYKCTRRWITKIKEDHETGTSS